MIAEKELEILKAENHLKVLQAELNFLKIKDKGKKPCLEEPQKEVISKLQQINTYEEDERKATYYVVFKGPKYGIHTNYQAIADLPVSYYTVAGSKFEANIVLQNTRAKNAQINSSIDKIRNSKVNPSLYGSSPLVKTILSKEEWINVQNKAKTLEYEKDFMYPVLRKQSQVHKMMIYENADPKIIEEMFQAGLIDSIYPGTNLNELSLLPKAMVEGIRKYQQRTRSPKIYLKFYSSCPDWEKEKCYPGYHFGRIGTVGGNFKNPGKSIIEINNPSEEEIAERRISELQAITKQIRDFKGEEFAKLNYCSNHITIWSKFNKQISPEELKLLKRQEERIVKMEQLSSLTKEILEADIIEIDEEITPEDKNEKSEEAAIDMTQHDDPYED